MASKKKQVSQYDQVKDILNKLQGITVPSYQGLHAFWLNPEVFMTATLYGNRLIAPRTESGGDPKSGVCCGSSSHEVEQPKEVESSTKSCCGSTDKKMDSTKDQAVITSVSESSTNDLIGDCWPSGGPGGGGGSGDGGSTNQRSEASGIIIGLRGDHPFDGSMFPKLLWDTDASASSEQIQIIANWIDADCPLSIEEENLSKEKLASVKMSNEMLALANGEMTHKVSTNKSNQDLDDSSSLKVRKEISSLSAQELQTYRDALDCMFQYKDYWQDERSFDYWARIHTNSCEHGWEQFGPWHRLYLYFFEQKLQDFDKNITLPYWSWSDYADVNSNTFNNKQPDLGVLPDAFQCFLNDKGLNTLKNAKTSDGKKMFDTKEISAFEACVKNGTQYNSGLRFLNNAGIAYEIINVDNVAKWSEKVRTIYDVLNSINPLWFKNRWPGSMGPLTQYPTQSDIDNILALDTWGDFGGGPSYDHHYGSLEKVHNGMHNFSGGTNPCYPGNIDDQKWTKIYADLELTADPQSVENPTYGWMTDNRITAFDPLFWSHHSNVDRIWARWQELHSGGPEENGALAPWSLTVDEALSTKKLGYTYVKDSVYYSVSNKVALSNFKSEPAPLSQNTLDTHRKAEIKLHRMQRGNLQNVNIRVFLNTPDANLSTPTRNNDCFVEEFSTFHGSCYGGPGHCNLPLDNTRRFDKRSIHHHEPRNYKIDATAAVQKLLNKGAKNLTVQLVVYGVNGSPIQDGLFIDGVSINFLD